MIPFASGFPGYRPSGGTITSISHVAIATASYTGGGGDPTSVTIPSGVQAGDFIIFWEYRVSADALNTPSGFTSLGKHSVSNQFTNQISIKKAAGTESGTSLSFYDLASYERGIAWVVRPDYTGYSSFTAGTAVASHSSANPSALVIGSSGITAPGLIFSKWSVSGTISGKTSSITPTLTQSYGNDGVYVQDIALTLVTGSPADNTIDMNDGGSVNNMFGTYCSIVI